MSRFGKRVGDWMRLSCGDLVADRADPRHVGRVDAIISGATVKVRWRDTGWISYLPLDHLDRIERYPSAR